MIVKEFPSTGKWGLQGQYCSRCCVCLAAPDRAPGQTVPCEVYCRREGQRWRVKEKEKERERERERPEGFFFHMDNDIAAGKGGR